MKGFDIESVMRRIADVRIEDAMAEGKFDNLPGRGEPVVIDEAPADENARAQWWALRLLRNNGFTPDEVRYRKMLDRLRAELASADTEDLVRALCGKINQLVHKINTLGTNAISLAVTPVDQEEELARFRSRRS